MASDKDYSADASVRAVARAVAKKILHKSASAPAAVSRRAAESLPPMCASFVQRRRLHIAEASAQCGGTLVYKRIAAAR